jgi:hypothetical protein
MKDKRPGAVALALKTFNVLHDRSWLARLETDSQAD